MRNFAYYSPSLSRLKLYDADGINYVSGPNSISNYNQSRYWICMWRWRRSAVAPTYGPLNDVDRLSGFGQFYGHRKRMVGEVENGHDICVYVC